jgi:hypothetical protein
MIPDLQIIDMQGTELPCSVPVYSLYVLNTANLQMVWEVSSDWENTGINYLGSYSTPEDASRTGFWNIPYN